MIATVLDDLRSRKVERKRASVAAIDPGGSGPRSGPQAAPPQ